ncbi:hypothetical protein WA158_008266 [Blastocystis sp. Blastoise]
MTLDYEHDALFLSNDWNKRILEELPNNNNNNNNNYTNNSEYICNINRNNNDDNKLIIDEKIKKLDILSILEDPLYNNNNKSINQSINNFDIIESSLYSPYVYNESYGIWSERSLSNAFHDYQYSELSNYLSSDYNNINNPYMYFDSENIIEYINKLEDILKENKKRYTGKIPRGVYQLIEKVCVFPCLSISDEFKTFFIILHFFNNNNNSLLLKNNIYIQIEVVEEEIINDFYEHIEGPFYKRKGYIMAAQAERDTQIYTQDNYGKMINRKVNEGDYLIYTEKELYMEKKNIFEIVAIPWEFEQTKKINNNNNNNNNNNYNNNNNKNKHQKTVPDKQSFFPNNRDYLKNSYHYTIIAESKCDISTIIHYLKNHNNITKNISNSNRIENSTLNLHSSLSKELKELYTFLFPYFHDYFILLNLPIIYLESDICCFLSLYESLPSTYIYKIQQILFNTIYIINKMELFQLIPSEILYSCLLFSILYPYLSFYKQLPLDLLLYSSLSLLLRYKQHINIYNTIASTLSTLVSAIMNMDLTNVIQSYTILYNTLFSMNNKLNTCTSNDIIQKILDDSIHPLLKYSKKYLPFNIEEISQQIYSYYNDIFHYDNISKNINKQVVESDSPLTVRYDGNNILHRNSISSISVSTSNTTLHSFILSNLSNTTVLLSSIIYMEMKDIEPNIYKQFKCAIFSTFQS